MDHSLISRLDSARKLLYIHGMIPAQENDRTKKRIEKMAARVQQIDALPEEPEAEEGDGPEEAA